MWFLAICKGISFISQKSYQNHQLNMITEAGKTIVTCSLVGATTYLVGKCIDKYKK